MEEKKKAPFPGTFSKNSKRTVTLKFAIFLSVLFLVISLSNTVQNITNFHMHFNLCYDINWLNGK